MEATQEKERVEVIDVNRKLLEGKFKKEIWEGLSVNCERFQNKKCILYCKEPCKMVEEIIKKCVLFYWDKHARGN